MKFWFTSFIVLQFFCSINAYCSYIKGKVNDESGNPLPFATVYIHNTTYGVTTNSLGEYFIELSPGNYEITYSFIGYQSVLLTVDLSSKPMTIDVELKTSSTQLNEFEIYANTKNKAKEVMSNVRKNRKKYLGSIDSYKCSTYVKNSLIRELKNAQVPV